ncbi:MAG: hypothetical protein A2583_14910 [Bdellovibrionales bacterium RIFOXYD1_FULL_53_11]|nr:MAG: hypothetical protein A2583_14910 [Bdellovibrionales bacterium RIFOXYD1_FULL_53_11]
MIWNQTEFNNKVAAVAKKLKIKSFEAQLLLAQERFLARLASIEDGHGFVWKGGSLLLRTYMPEETTRFTVDIDLLAKGISVESSEAIFKKAMTLDLEDGFAFENLIKSFMERDTPYGGERYEMDWSFFKKTGAPNNNSMKLKLDVCAGDDVDEEVVAATTLFLATEGTENLSFRIYPPEFIFAEKLETAVRFKSGNSRFKDFIDLWVLSENIKNTKKLRAAVDRCFKRRGTPYDTVQIVALLSDKAHIQQLEQYGRKHYERLKLPSVATLLKSVTDLIKKI